MNQSAILRVCYEAIYKNLSALGDETKIFCMNAAGSLEEPKNEVEAIVCPGVSDVSQVFIDKNGEKVVMDEMLFEAPAQIGCILSLTIIAKTYPPLLETVGLLIQYFKDNNVVLLEDYKWHGEDEGKIVIESVVRAPEPRKESIYHDYPALTIQFLMEMGINSLKGTPFKRVEKAAVRGNLIEEAKNNLTG